MDVQIKASITIVLSLDEGIKLYKEIGETPNGNMGNLMTKLYAELNKIKEGFD